MGQVVLEAQNAFVEGKQILDATIWDVTLLFILLPLTILDAILGISQFFAGLFF